MTQAREPGLIRSLRAEFRSENLVPSLTAGALIGVNEIVFALSVGSLIFSGALSPFVSYGIAIALIADIAALVVISLRSSAPGITGGLQDSTAVIMAVVAATVFTTAATGSVESRLVTVVVALGFTTFLTGLLLFALGALKLGGLVRYIPYPVIGGFLAGTGWLLLKGSFGVMASAPLTLQTLPLLLQPGQMVLWIPGVVFALVLLLAQRRIDHFLVVPAILAGAFLLFYLVLLITGLSIGQAVDRGLLMASVSNQVTWQPLSPQKLMAADWAAILGQAGNIAFILVLSVVGVLLNASGIELAIRRDVDLDRELRGAGLANLLAGLGGGIVGFHALDLSTLSYRLRARSRLAGIVAAFICLVMLLAGAPLLTFFPKTILGGLLLFLGLGFLVEWLVDGWHRLSRADYAVVVLILVTIAVTDFLVGVAAGLAATVVLFIVNYSRVSVVHHRLTGAEVQSTVERSPHHQRQLLALGEHTCVLELRGFVFFGTANALLTEIRNRALEAERPSLLFLVLDFRRVTGLDSSAALSFVKAGQLAEAEGFTLVVTGLSDAVRGQFEQGGLSEGEAWVRILPDLDHGLEWCEDRLLEKARVTQVGLPATLRAQLADSGFDPERTTCLAKYLEETRFDAGDSLIQQGDTADDLYFVEMGAISVNLELEDGGRVRLSRLGSGTVVGELGLYLDAARTASVVADGPTVAYRLTRGALDEMTAEDPTLAAEFHALVVRLVSERLVAANRSVEALHR